MYRKPLVVVGMVLAIAAWAEAQPQEKPTKPRPELSSGRSGAAGVQSPFQTDSAGPPAATAPDPWEIIVYEHPNYIGQSVSYRLAPGMRQKLVPVVEPKGQASSFLLGSNVAVILFPYPNFICGTLPFDSTSVSQASLVEIVSPGAAGAAAPVADVDYNDRVFSLILVPKDRLGNLGVWLTDEPSSNTGHRSFFPAPEWEWEREYAVPELGSANLDKNAKCVRIDDPSLVQVTLYEQRDFQGASITFPGAVVTTPYFDDSLGKYGWSDRAASLKVTWTGPWLKASKSKYSTQYGVDMPGSDYKRLFVDGGPGECEAACDFEAQCQAFTWVKPGAQGPKAVCWLKSEVPAARSNVNAVSGYKPGTGVKGTKPAPQEPPTISGFKNVLPAAPQSPTASGVKGAAPAQQGPYEYGVNLPGGDLKGLFMDGGPEECEKACNAEAQCQAFTWVKAGIQGPKAACWLKGNPVPVPQKFPDAVSGYKKLPPKLPK